MERNVWIREKGGEKEKGLSKEPKFKIHCLPIWKFQRINKKIYIREIKIINKETKEYILLYKPRGVVTTTSDDKKRKTVDGFHFAFK